MVERIINKIKSILFADPQILFEEERKLANKTFYFKGTNGKGVLLIHGWSSTAYEVRRLGKYLNEEGFTVLGPNLRGHGTKPEDLENVKWEDWVNDLSDSIDQLNNECDKVYIAGTSIGGNLAMLLSKIKPDVEGVVLMATAYRIKFENIIIALGNIGRLFTKYNRKFYPPTFGSKTTITRLISYQRYPFKNLEEAYIVIKKSRKIINQIQQPCFIIKSTHDHIITRNSLEKIYNKIGSKIKRKKYIVKAYHTFISDIKNEKVFEEIAEFLKSL